MAVRECVRRYAPAELLALIGALTGYLVADLATGNTVLAAYAAATGDNLAYYGLLVTREVRTRWHTGSPLLAGAGACGALVIEFGPAEALDSLVVRPASVAIGTAALGPVAGVLAAKVVADLAFYVPVITTYELRKRCAWSADATFGRAEPRPTAPGRRRCIRRRRARLMVRRLRVGFVGASSPRALRASAARFSEAKSRPRRRRVER